MKTLSPDPVGGCNSLRVKHLSLRVTTDTHRSSLDEVKLMAQFDPVLKGHTLRMNSVSHQVGRSCITSHKSEMKVLLDAMSDVRLAKRGLLKIDLTQTPLIIQNCSQRKTCNHSV